MSRVETRTVGRRLFVVQAGGGVLGLAMLGLAACSVDEPCDVAGDQATGSPGARVRPAGSGWSRVDFAYVSAYLLVRGREAALVDVGFGDSADRIGAVLDAAGAGWGGVRHMVITHAHYDHCGGLPEVADRAAGAALYAGEPQDGDAGEEILQGNLPRPLRAVSDGEEVFGLQVVATPGHTQGHISVFDPHSAVLVAGDALTNTFDGQLAGANLVFTASRAAAVDSVRKLAALEPRLIFVGHGPPVQRDAADKLHRLAESK